MIRALLLGMLAGAVSAQVAPVLEPVQLTQDFSILRHALEDGHAGLYRYSSKPEMDARFANAELALRKPMDVFQFYRTLVPVLAAVKCGHTEFSISPELVARDREMAFPFTVRIIDSKIYLFRDFSTTDGHLAGSEVLSVNGIPVSQLLPLMLQAVSGDGDSATARPYRVGKGGAFSRLLYPLFGIQSPFLLRIRGQGRGESVTVTGQAQGVLDSRLAGRYPGDRWSGLAADLHFTEDRKIAVMKVAAFGGFTDPEHKISLAAFIENSFGQMAETQVKALILDLRDNGGGAHELGEMIFSHLIDQQFTYYKDLVLNAVTFAFLPYATPSTPIPADQVELGPDNKYHHVKQANWGVQQPRQPRFEGKVYVLMNGGSFSTTCELLGALHGHHLATFIGEESSGTYYGNTSGLKYLVTLPNSRLRVLVPTVGYYLALDGSSPHNRGIMPDYPVHYTIGELLRGDDKEMAAAMTMARAGQ